jgi:hypothetical protein
MAAANTREHASRAPIRAAAADLDGAATLVVPFSLVSLSESDTMVSPPRNQLVR